jgi:hypothetical protein
LKLSGVAVALLSLAIVASPATAADLPSTPRLAQDSRPAVNFQPDGTIRHVASGFVFPMKLATLEFEKEHVFSPEDVSARYGQSTLTDPWLDLYIYPAAGTLDTEAAEIGQIIVDHYSATAVAQVRPLPPSAADGRIQWYRGSIQGQEIITGFVLVRRGGWAMKVRMTSPAAAGGDAIERLVAAVAEVPWEWVPVQAPPIPDKITVRR